MDNNAVIEQYVDALDTSSSRARSALYVVIVATVLIFIATHNVEKDAWPIRRLDTWYKYARADRPTPPQPIMIAGGDAKRLADIREEYIKQFASRAVFTTSPIPGVSIDVNDLGLIGGITLTLLMLVLLACIAREHENLYLALYKVRQLCESEKEMAQHGSSSANLLYHALAMTQVINSPPTLARWQRSQLRSAFRAIFLAPAVVYWWVVNTEWAGLTISRAYGVDVRRTVAVEALAALLLFILGLIVWFHSSAMEERWARAFFRINPNRLYVPQMAIGTWLRLRTRQETPSQLKRHRLISDLVTTLNVSDSEMHEGEIAPIVFLDNNRLSADDLRSAVAKIRGTMPILNVPPNADRDKSCWQFIVSQNVLVRGQWTIKGKWLVPLTAPPTA